MQAQDTAVVRIPLRNRLGEVVAHTLVDADHAHLAERSWHISKGYAETGRNQRLHRLLLGLRKHDGRDCDHINGDRLDNRLANLRIVTRAQNGQNKGTTSKSGYRNVYWNGKRGYWYAQIKVKGKRYSVQCCKTPEEAAEAARMLRAEHMPYAVESRCGS